MFCTRRPKYLLWGRADSRAVLFRQFSESSGAARGKLYVCRSEALFGRRAGELGDGEAAGTAGAGFVGYFMLTTIL